MALRKWPYARYWRGGTSAMAMGVVVALTTAQPGAARTARSPLFELDAALFGGSPRRARKPLRIAIPLPQPRPADAAPRLQPRKSNSADVLPQPRPVEAPPRPPEMPVAAAPAPEAPPAPRAPSACRQALTDAIAIAPSLPDISGPGDCGGEDIVRLESVVLRDMTRVALKPAATLRCEMAAAVAAWVRDDVAPLAAVLGSAPVSLDNFDSFECRGRNRVSGAKISEHGHANALDVRGFAMKNGASVALTDRATARETREKVLQSVCARFTTVLGPGSDGYHEDHIHLDLAARRSGYRICQWQIDDLLPPVAPLLPAARPDDAPPRPKGDNKSEDKDDR